MIGKKNYDATKMHRALRNHMAGHQVIVLKYDYEPCAFCCFPGCKVTVESTSRQTKNVVGKQAAIRFGAMLYPNCKTYPSIRPFAYMFCTPVKQPKFPTSKQTILLPPMQSFCLVIQSGDSSCGGVQMQQSVSRRPVHDEGVLCGKQGSRGAE